MLLVVYRIAALDVQTKKRSPPRVGWTALLRLTVEAARLQYTVRRILAQAGRAVNTSGDIVPKLDKARGQVLAPEHDRQFAFARDVDAFGVLAQPQHQPGDAAREPHHLAVSAHNIDTN